MFKNLSEQLLKIFVLLYRINLPYIVVQILGRYYEKNSDFIYLMFKSIHYGGM